MTLDFTNLLSSFDNPNSISCEPTSQNKQGGSMKNKNLTKATLALSLIWASFGSADSFSSLELAQNAYLKGDLSKMTLLIRNVLMEKPTTAVKTNALELLSKAYQVDNGRGIRPDWKLPQELRYLKLNQVRREKGSEISYTLQISANTASKGTVKNLQLIKYPDQVVLDKEAKIGEYEESVESEPSEGIYVGLHGEKQEVPFEEGLYLLNITLSNGNRTQGWVILNDLTSSRAPEVHSPKMNEVVTTQQPTFQYEDFTSPEHKGNEKRSIWMAVVEMVPPTYSWNEKWSLYAGHLPRTQVTVGKEKDGYGVTELKDGQYHFYLSYREERKFGDIRIGRQSVRQVPFSIKQ